MCDKYPDEPSCGKQLSTRNKILKKKNLSKCMISWHDTKEYFKTKTKRLKGSRKVRRCPGKSLLGTYVEP